MAGKLKVLSVGGFTGYGVSNTCLHRTWALESFCTVDRIDTRSKPYPFYFRLIFKLFHLGINLKMPDYLGINKQILEAIEQKKYDLIWIDKGWFLNAKTLQQIRKKYPETKIVGYSPDEMTQRHNQSYNFLQALPYYDVFVTTKSYTVEALKKMGAKEVYFIDNAYESKFHFPRKLDQKTYEKLAGEVGFIGAWEADRAEKIVYLAENGISVRVWGGGSWLQYEGKYPKLTIEKIGLFSEDYSRALSGFKLSLCFLRKMNHDVQTTRSIEIPACKGFLMAERTAEHQGLFEEGKEAEFFETKEELLEKCRHYLNHEDERVAVVEQGYQRCIKDGYSNTERIKKVVLNVIGA